MHFQWRQFCKPEMRTFPTKSRVPAPEDIKNPRLFKAFSFNNSRPIQGLLQSIIL